MKTINGNNIDGKMNMRKINLRKNLLALIVLLALIGAVNAATVTTDKDDYAPGEVVLISGEGFAANSALTVEMIRPNGVDSCDVSACYWRFLDGLLTSGSDGAFSNYRYDLNGDLGNYTVVVSDGTTTAQVDFTDGHITITSVTLNGGDKVTVGSGEIITVSITVETKKGKNWMSTRYEIEGQGKVCINTPDNIGTGVYTESFTITAPTLPTEEIPKDYTVKFKAYGGSDTCDDPKSNEYKLEKSKGKGITVIPESEPIPETEPIPAPEPIIAIAIISALAPGLAYGLVRRRKNKN